MGAGGGKVSLHQAPALHAEALRWHYTCGRGKAVGTSSLNEDSRCVINREEGRWGRQAGPEPVS